MYIKTKDFMTEEDVDIIVENIIYINKSYAGLQKVIKINFGENIDGIVSELTLEDIQRLTNNYFFELDDNTIYNRNKICYVKHNVIMFTDGWILKSEEIN